MEPFWIELKFGKRYTKILAKTISRPNVIVKCGVWACCRVNCELQVAKKDKKGYKLTYRFSK